jgi:hypothetical protein
MGSRFKTKGTSFSSPQEGPEDLSTNKAYLEGLGL